MNPQQVFQAATLSTWLKSGLTILYPPVCALCRQICQTSQIAYTNGRGNICRPCLASLPLRIGAAQHLAWPLLSGDSEHPPAEVLCAGYYRNTLRQALLHVKFSDAPDIAAALSGLIVRLVVVAGIRYDAVMAIPLHKDRLHERGYNQAGLLTTQVCQALQIPDMSELILRIRATGRQSAQQNKEERMANLDGAFRLSGQLARKQPAAGSLHTSHVLLLDDILTTGATLTAAASVLWQAGFLVTGLVVASNRQS